MATAREWYKNSDNIVRLDNQYDTYTAAYLNSATVTATLKDLAGTEVTGVSWPVTLTYVSASNGQYIAVVDKTAAVTVGLSYRLEITLVQSGIDKFYSIPLVIVEDDGQ